MANKTANYDLTKPLVSEFYDVEVQNGNMDKIDAALKKDADSIKTLQDGQKKKADLGEDGKVLTEQLPEMNYDPTGTAAQAVSTHNTSPNAHTSLFAAKQNKLTGAQGQVVGFDSQGNAQAQDPPGGGSGKRVCRFVVGTSTAGWTADDCDYLCDGTADDVEINAAIQALPSTGGEVVILDGTYNITATIAVNKDNVTLSGNGAATVLKRMWNSTSSSGVINITGDGGGVKEIQIDGNQASYSAIYNQGLRLTGCEGTNISKCLIKNCKSDSIYASSGKNLQFLSNAMIDADNTGIYTSGSSFVRIIGNYCNNIGSIGIFALGISSSNIVIAGNTCANGNNDGIDCEVPESVIADNTCNNNSGNGINMSGNYSSCVGNTCCSNTENGIRLNGDEISVSGNTCYNNSLSGLAVYSGNKCVVSGNVFMRGTGTSSDYTSTQYTINNESNAPHANNLFIGNLILGKNYVDNGENSTFSNNKYN